VVSIWSRSRRFFSDAGAVDLLLPGGRGFFIFRLPGVDPVPLATMASDGDETISVDFVTLPKVAALLGIHRSTAVRLVDQGKFPLPTLRVGRKILVPAQAVEDLKAGRVEGYNPSVGR
jgi:excisionase family DNA binding protein